MRRSHHHPYRSTWCLALRDRRTKPTLHPIYVGRGLSKEHVLLQAIIDEAEIAFYEGELAKAINTSSTRGTDNA